jgi:hypothetical protein
MKRPSRRFASSSAERETSIASAMDSLAQLIEANSANISALERAAKAADDIYQQASREDIVVFNESGEMGASIIRRETFRDELQNSKCSKEPRESIFLSPGRF